MLLRRMVAEQQLAAQGREITEGNLAAMLATATPAPVTEGPPTAVVPSLPVVALPHHDNEPAHLPDLGPPHHVLARAGTN